MRRLWGLLLVIVAFVGLIGVLGGWYEGEARTTRFPNPDSSASLLLYERPADANGRVFVDVFLKATLSERQLEKVGTYEGRSTTPPEWIDRETVNVCALAEASGVGRTITVPQSDYGEARTFKVVSQCPAKASND